MKLNRESLKGVKVLVADDEPDSLEVVSILFTHYGATVFKATDGQECLEMAQSERPLFIVSDLAMPRMTGEELVKELKNDRMLSNIPVIALSAHAKKEDYSRAIASGFHGYITKPLKPESFVQEVIDLLLDIPYIAEALKQE